MDGREHFEEALFDYFVPYGILAEYLDLYKRIEMVDLCSRNMKRRPYASSMSRRLLPYMEHYFKNPPDETIWEFLNKNGFDKQINPHRTYR